VIGYTLQIHLILTWKINLIDGRANHKHKQSNDLQSHVSSNSTWPQFNTMHLWLATTMVFITVWPWPYDLRVNAYRATAIDYVYTKLIAQAVFLLECGHTQAQTDAIDHPTTPLTTLAWVIINCNLWQHSVHLPAPENIADFTNINANFGDSVYTGPIDHISTVHFSMLMFTTHLACCLLYNKQFMNCSHGTCEDELWQILITDWGISKSVLGRGLGAVLTGLQLCFIIGCHCFDLHKNFLQDQLNTSRFSRRYLVPQILKIFSSCKHREYPNRHTKSTVLTCITAPKYHRKNTK